MSDRRRDKERPRERGGYDQPRERDHERDRDADRHRDRDRGQDKERDRDRDYRRARKRSRSRSPSADRDRSRRHRSHSHSHSHSHRSRSPDAGRHKRRREGSPVPDLKDDRKPDPPSAPKAAEEAAPVGDGDVDAEELEMMKMMGIPVGFDSTKGKYVPGADVSGVRAVTKRQPRQYMNRRGGFNRPLPPEVNR